MAHRTKAVLEFARTRLLVRDFERSWWFYRDVLGLTPVAGHGSPPYGEFTSTSGALVSLFDQRAMAKAVGVKPARYDPHVTGRSALVFETSDVDGFARQLRRRRIPLLAGPTDRREWGIRTVHLRDPDGNLIEVYCELPRSSR